MSYDLSQVKVLIVEDMQPMLSLTISLMNMFGFKHVHGAKSAEEGYYLFRQYNHDIVITDWLMEPKDGLELIRMIRQREDSPNKYVPVIFMTGYSDQTRVEMARDMGVTEFLVKPYSARDMYARIVQVAEKPRQFVDDGKFFGPDRRRRRNFDFHGMEKRKIQDVNASRDARRPHGNIEIILRDLTEEAQKI